jgi:hypothetical protein
MFIVHCDTQKKQMFLPVQENGMYCLWCDLTGCSVRLLLKMLLLKVSDIRDIVPYSLCLLYEDVTTQPVLHIKFYNLHRVYRNVLIYLFGHRRALYSLCIIFLQAPILNKRLMREIQTSESITALREFEAPNFKLMLYLIFYSVSNLLFCIP